jgi:internalin A
MREPLSPLSRLKLYRKLSSLSYPEFEQLIYALKPPSGIIPAGSAPHGERASALLAWAESSGGSGLDVVQDILSEIISPDTSTKLGSASIEVQNEAERRIQKALQNNNVELNLSGLDLSTIPASISELKNLKKLSLAQNIIEEIPRDLFELEQLSWLSLENNKIMFIPRDIGKLCELKELYLGNNSLSSLPNEIGRLTKLEILHINNNRIENIPNSISNLDELRVFDAHENSIKVLPEEFCNLKNVLSLSLHKNKLTEIPSKLGQLKELKELSLQQNDLLSIPKALGELTNLERLFLHGNDRLRLSDEVLGPSREQVVSGKTAVNPSLILKYYFQTRHNSKPLNETKLVLVGFGSVGKTSLVKRLIDNEFDHDSKKTDGIKIDDWSIALKREEFFQLHVWDFGEGKKSCTLLTNSF